MPKAKKKWYVSFRGTRTAQWIEADTMLEAKKIFIGMHGGSITYVQASRKGELWPKGN